MKRFSYSILFSSLVVLCCLNISCKKYLDLKPQDGIIRQNFWQTKEQLQSAVTGMYASLLNTSVTGNVTVGIDYPLVECLFMWGEGRADMVVPTLGASADEVDVYNANILPTNSVAKWGSVYKVINICNTVIQYGPGVLEVDNTLSKQQLDAYLSEALALRSLMYFYLVRSFRDVPLQLTAVSTDAEIVQLEKSPADTILNRIVQDLKTAEQTAVTTFGSVAADKGKITRFTVNAILADVYLWMENYEASLEQCNKIINSEKFGLVSGNNPNTWFNTLYYNGNSVESIFEFQFDVQKLNSFNNLFNTSRRRYLASPRVMEEVYTIDYVDDTKRDIRGDAASVRTNDNAIYKFIALDYNTVRPADNSYAHWFVYRYADILLMKAEALNQLGRGAEALDIINDPNPAKGIRARARALALTYKNPPATDVDEIRDYILEERAREFAFEGKRWYDVLRNAKRNNYGGTNKNVLLNMIAKAVPPERQQRALSTYRDNNSHYYPIFYYELQLDPKLVQNPFYK